MIRRMIEINRDACNGCGLCANACQEGAIGMIDGKATLLRDDYCDGLGNCLPVCPTGAITFLEREADAFDEEAVKAHQQKHSAPLPCDSPDSSCLSQWPVQVKLVPIQAPYFTDSHLLIAADCTAYAYGRFHQDFIKNKITLIGCPKLDEGDYSEKLTEIIRSNSIQSLTVVRMEVPCCRGIEMAVKTALLQSGKSIPLSVVTISTEGTILER